MQSLPKINSRYWIALCAASIFGTNTGDYLAEEMHIDHLVGLAPLAVLLALIFGAARIVPQAAIFLFWAAIITVRTAATNVGDAFHGFNIHFETSIPLVTIVLIAAVYAYRSSRQRNILGLHHDGRYLGNIGRRLRILWPPPGHFRGIAHLGRGGRLYAFPSQARATACALHLLERHRNDPCGGHSSR
jgi:hypothetical protein